MFYNVDERFSRVDVYGVKKQQLYLIDPHDIFRTRTIGFDNIHRGILGSVVGQGQANQFCPFLEYRFPYFDRFIITLNYYPDFLKEPYKQFQEVRYQCRPDQ